MILRPFIFLAALLFIGVKTSIAQTTGDDEAPFAFYIPNAFSPNNDGINDEFYGKGESISEFEMSIYDRSNSLIFYTDNINNHWDGTTNKNNRVANSDVYIYIVLIKDNTTQTHKFVGSVTLVK